MYLMNTEQTKMDTNTLNLCVLLMGPIDQYIQFTFGTK